jgi:hypothetical protein
VLPLSDGIRDGVVQLVSTLGSAVTEGVCGCLTRRVQMFVPKKAVLEAAQRILIVMDCVTDIDSGSESIFSVFLEKLLEPGTTQHALQLFNVLEPPPCPPSFYEPMHRMVRVTVRSRST